MPARSGRTVRPGSRLRQTVTAENPLHGCGQGYGLCCTLSVAVLQIQEESANAGFAPAGKACPGVEALNGVTARAGYRPAIECHAAFAVVDVGDKDAVGFRFAGGREVVKRMGSE